MLVWLGELRLGWQLPINGLTSSLWHAHEMVYGYSLAVIAGFLLTAVPKWTNTASVSGAGLKVIFLAWLMARVVGLFGGTSLLWLTAVLELLFFTSLMIGIGVPIIRNRVFKQSGILVKVLLLATGNAVFYLGVTGYVDNGAHYGLIAGFYLVIALILTLGRRVIPAFIEGRLTLKHPLKNPAWVDGGSLLLFLVFWINEVFSPQSEWIGVVAMSLFFVHLVRLYHWYRPGIWTDPLLWVLYVSYLFIVIAFGLKGISILGIYYLPSLSLHLFAVGGIGLMTTGMMSRVALGHTGRNIRESSAILPIAFACLGLAAVVRVLFPIINIESYFTWISISQLLWILGFGIIIFIYFPILVRPRLDGQQG